MNTSQSIPTLGKLYLLISVVLSVMVFSKSVDPYSLSFTFKQTIFELGLWRPFTAMLYLSRVGILLPVQLLFALIAFKKAVTKMYFDNKADFVWLFVLSAISLAIFSTFLGLHFYGSSFIMILFMMWAIQHPTDFLQIFGIHVHVHSIYFPVIYATVMILLGSSFKNYMAGFLLGLLLGFIKNPAFIQRHGQFFPTPAFIKNYFFVEVEQVEQPASSNKDNSQRPSDIGSKEGAYFRGPAYRLN